MTKPTYRAYIVEAAPAGSDRKSHWIEVGTVWNHKSGKGFDLVIPTGISVSGRIVCITPKDESEIDPR